MKRRGTTILISLLLLWATAGEQLAQRKARLTEEPERGGGRGSIEEVILTITGYTIATAAGIAAAAFVASKLGLLK